MTLVSTNYKDMEVTIEQVKEWYAKETNRTVVEFDDYDIHVCRVAFAAIKEFNKP